MLELSKLFVTLGLQSKDFMTGIRKATGGTQKLEKGTNKLGSSLTAMKRIAVGAFIGWGINRLAGSFLDAAKTTEGYKVRLNSLLGSVKEGNRAFAEMSKFATSVSFSYEEVMGSATTLAGVMSGGVDEINRWMPMIADLAAVSGLSIQETTGQIVRMYSAGAGAADLFRERGILQMLGFKAGVSVTAEETKEILIKSWEKVGSKWRGVSGDLSKTWEGTMSMLGDQWFQFRNTVMDKDVFAFMKTGAQVFLEQIKELQKFGDLAKWAADMSKSVLKSFEIIIKAAALVGDSFRGWQMIWMGLKVIYDTFLLGVLEGAEKLAKALRFGLEQLGQDKAVNKLNEEIIELNVAQQGAVISIEEGVKAIEDFVAEGSNYSKITKLINDLKKATVTAEKATVKLGKTSGDVTTTIVAETEKELKEKAKLLKKEREIYAKTWAIRIKLSRDAARKELEANKTFFDGVKDGFNELIETQKSWADQGKESVFQFANDAENALAGFFNPLKDDFLEISTLWDSMLGSMVGALTRSVAEMAVQWGVAAISTAGSSFGWWDTGAWKIDKDQVGMVHEGEMVVPADIAKILRGEGGTFNADTAFGGKNPEFAKDFSIGAIKTHGLYSMQGFGHLLAGNIDAERLIRGILDPRALISNTVAGGLTNALPNALGLEGKFADFGQIFLGMTGGMALGPLGAIAGAVAGAGLLDAIGDVLDLRENEAFKDFFEGAFGNVMGRQAFKSFQKSMSLAGGAGGGEGAFGGGFSSMGAADVSNTFGGGSEALARHGGIFSGPESGFPVTMHGTERVLDEADNKALIAAINRGNITPIINVYIGNEQLNTRIEKIADGVRVKAEQAGLGEHRALF